MRAGTYWRSRIRERNAACSSWSMRPAARRASISVSLGSIGTGSCRGQLGRPAACMAGAVPSDPENCGECDGTDRDDVDDDHQDQEVPTSGRQ